MVQQLLPILPQQISSTGVWIALGGLVFAAAVWLIAARFSRMVLALASVGVGGVLGMMLPRWQAWPVNTMATAVGGAVVLGMLAFALHRVWVALALGLLMACWAVVGTWIVQHHDTEWKWPDTFSASIKPMPQYLKEEVWEKLPPEMRQVVPYAAGAAMFTGAAIALLWPRLGRVMFYSAVGVTVMLALGLTLMQTEKPELLGYIPSRSAVQFGVLGAMVVFGMIVQWLVLPTPKALPHPTTAEA